MRVLVTGGEAFSARTSSSGCVHKGSTPSCRSIAIATLPWSTTSSDCSARRREVVLWGDGSPTREFVYVGDCAKAVVLATERYDSSEPINVGTDFEASVRDLAELTGFDGEIVWETTKPNGQLRRRFDVSGTGELFGFNANTPPPWDGLQQTIASYRDHRSAGAAPG